MANKVLMTVVGGDRVLVNSNATDLDLKSVYIGETNGIQIKKTGTSLDFGNATVIGVTAAANGVATLDAQGKIPATQLPNSVMEFKGAWNANTNSPELADGTGNNGDVYRVSVAGDASSWMTDTGPKVFALGDWIMYNGSVWQHSPAPAFDEAQVRGTVLTGLSAASGGTLAATDSILAAFGKLEYRVALDDAKVGFTEALAIGSVLDGFTAAAGGTITEEDSILEAFGKLEYRVALNDAKVTYDVDTARGDIIAASITEDDTTHAPDGASVFTALAGKSDTSHDHDLEYDALGAAATAESNAKSYADGLAVNYDAAGAAATALDDAKDYADGLASNYDAAGAAATAESNAKSYADGLAVNYDAAGAAATAESNAKSYADGLAVNYDAAGAAATAESNAKSYADGLAVNYDAAGAAATAESNAKSYADTLVGGVAVRKFTNDNASAITIRQIAYEKSTGHIDLAKADAVATGANVKLVVVKAASIATDGEGDCYFRGEVIPDFSSLTIGAPYYVSAATAGAITATAPSASGNYVYKVGHAISATEILFEPEYLWSIA